MPLVNSVLTGQSGAMSAVLRGIAIAALVVFAVGVRSVNRRWFTTIRRAQPGRERTFGIESRVADGIHVVMVVLVGLAILAA
jgi:hypothetical protein